MAKKSQPFTPKEVETLKLWQSSAFHPFTCCSHDGCNRINQPNQGELIPNETGWICPCGKWKQDWCHDFMLDEKNITDYNNFLKSFSQ